MLWAHLRASTVTAKNILGPSESIGSIYLDYIGWPTRSSHPLLLNGPMWAFPTSAVKLHVGSTNYYDKMFAMGSWPWSGDLPVSPSCPLRTLEHQFRQCDRHSKPLEEQPPPHLMYFRKRR